MKVELIHYMGDDYTILRAARVSTGSKVSKGEKKDRGLIRYLYRNNHMTPFEMPQFIWYVKCPIFVARQILRHRAFSVNEASGRFKKFEWETFEPIEWRKQDTKNKQGSMEELDFNDTIQDCFHSLNESYKYSNKAYEDLIDNGVAREQARLVMPVGHYTEFYMRTDLRNLLHFLELRMDGHAQKETQDIAFQIYDKIIQTGKFPWTMEIFYEMQSVKSVMNQLLDKYKNNLDELSYKLEKMTED